MKDANGFLSSILNFIDWHLPWSVATWNQIEEHFNLTIEEISMIESAINHKLLKEYVVYEESKHFQNKYDKAYVVLKVSDVRRLVNLRRKNN